MRNLGKWKLIFSNVFLAALKLSLRLLEKFQMGVGKRKIEMHMSLPFARNPLFARLE
jgi:hypothetical protein